MTEPGLQENRHYNAGTTRKAVSLLHSNYGKARIISGGVDIVHLIKREVISPQVLVNIKDIQGMSSIRERAGNLTIGALARINDIETSPLINRRYPLLAKAAHSIATPQIRNMSTLAGNLCQQVWCQYYRRSPAGGNVFNCLRKGGKKCFAVTGNNAEHAITGSGRCRAVCPSDMATALAAMSASLKIIGPGGSRNVPVVEFYADMGNVLMPDELITGIVVPYPDKNARQYFGKFRLRKSIDFAVASIASVITIRDGLVAGSTIVLGGIAPAPCRAVTAEQYIEGKEINPAMAEEAAERELKKAKPLSMNAYKVPIAKALLKRAILSE